MFDFYHSFLIQFQPLFLLLFVIFHKYSYYLLLAFSIKCSMFFSNKLTLVVKFATRSVNSLMLGTFSVLLPFACSFSFNAVLNSSLIRLSFFKKSNNVFIFPPY